MRTSPARYRKALLLQFLVGGCLLSCAGPQRDGAVDGARLAAARAAATRMRAMLEDYYGGPQVLRDTWYVPPDGAGQADGRGFLADKMARAIVWGERFAIGAIGSSVTAGTDNCDYDTYPSQLERLLHPVFAAAGAALEVRNAGQGGGCGDSYRNQIWCLRALVGDDVDVVHYSCGRRVRTSRCAGARPRTYFEAGNGDVAVHHEMFYRWALLMDRAPVPQLVYANGCDAMRKEDDALFERYGRYGVNALCMTRGIERAGYPGKEWGVVGDSLHATTRYGEDASLDEPRRRSLGVVFRNWHPGPLLFQTTADALAYRYSDALLLALDRIEAEPAPRVRWPRSAPRLDRRSLPEPLVCDAEWCRVDAPPRCAYYEKPRYGAPQVALVGAGDDPETGRPAPPARGWRHVRAAPDRAMPAAERALPECAHRSFCAGFQAEPGTATDWLTFRLPRLERGRIEVCCSSKRCGRELLDAGAEFEIDGAPVAGPAAEGKCVLLRTRFASADQARAEAHEVRLRPPAQAEPPPAITHVFGL